MKIQTFKLAFYTILIICLFSIYHQQDAEQTVDNVTLKILGHSGKMVINKTMITENSTETESITIRFGALKERNSNGEEVGKAGSIKHSFNNFAQLDFTISPLIEGTFQNLSVYQTKLTAKKIVVDDTVFSGYVYIFKQNGTIETGENEKYDVKPGNIKFSVELENWPFCQEEATCPGATCCKNGNLYEVGSLIDFSLEMSGSKKEPTSKDSKSFDLGNSQFILSAYVKADEKWAKLSDGFPSYNRQGEADIFTLRFPKFEKKLNYDPIVAMELAEEPVEPEKGSNFWKIVVIIVAVALVLVGAFLLYRYIRANGPKETLMP
jgi:hypothetical protein